MPEPIPRNLAETMTVITRIHGPKRYWSDNINGATALLDACDAWHCAQDLDEKLSIDPGRGPGAVWAWFVGSPRAFLFGFVRSQSAATRKLRETLKTEATLVIAVAGR